MKLLEESLQNEIKSFEDETSYINFFDLSECELYHIQSNPEEDFVRLTNIKNLIYDINDKGEVKTGFSGIKKENIDVEILSRIEHKEIVSLIVYQRRILYLDENSRSMIAQKTKCSGSSLYDKSIVADIELQSNMNNYMPTGKLIKNYPIAVIRKCGKCLILVAILSRSPESINKVISYEMNNKDLVLYSYERTSRRFCVIFDCKEINGYIPSIIIEYSDTGNGNARKLAIRPADAKTPIPLYEISDEKYNLEELMKTVEILISNKSTNIVENPLSVLSACKGFKAIGKDRIKKYFISKSLKLPENEFYKKVLSIPDEIGKVNRSTDTAFLSALGDSFKLGAM